MLTSVPEAINSLSRNVVINHPNSFQCVLMRKVVNRTAATSVGGLPTLGGMAVISSDDEEDVSWEVLGNAYSLQTDHFDPSQMMDRQDANNGAADEFRFLIEPETAGEFDIKKLDVMYLILGQVRLAYQIIGIETVGNIPPYTLRYVCNRRDDLHVTV